MEPSQTSDAVECSPRPPEGKGRPARRVLLVDDQPFFLVMGQAILRGGGYEVQTAPSGREALRVARATRPDAILLDVEMPGLNGFETCRRLKADPVTAAIPVAMLTATLDPQLNEKAFQSGAEATILKGVSAARLLNMLQVVLTTARRPRAASRADVALPVEYESAGEVVSAETLNLSADGMFIKTPSATAPGTLLHLRFGVPGAARWECCARVVWTRDPGEKHPYPSGMGVQFVDLAAEARAAIVAFVAAGATRARPPEAERAGDVAGGMADESSPPEVAH